NLPLKFKQIPVERTILLRHEVVQICLCIDKVKLPEDNDVWHFGDFIDDPLGKDDPVAAISLFQEPIPIDNVPAHFATSSGRDTFLEQRLLRFRDFACETSTQSQGVVTALLKHAMHFACSELKAEVLWCDATVSSADWYSR
ncbi:hypothetical protein GGU10DRAFT_277501, partial [Lentinula aff. detonsa]